ncbi:MAG: error-prone DNA polymerase [Pseudomonadales bacterium]|nr:error-prone DNA polymerase [Pseudomonadales bacterium]
MATSPDQPDDLVGDGLVPSRVSGTHPPFAYAELHAVSNFSFLRGASHPEELVRTAHALGYRAIAITDECSVAGVVKAHLAARDLDIKLIVGAEFHIPRDAGDIHLVLLAPDRHAYGQLSQLVTLARRRAPKGDYTLGLEDLRQGVEGCLALWIPGQGSFADQLSIGHQVKDLLPNLWISLELFLERDDLDKTAHVLTLSSRLSLPVVASNGACMHIPERQPLRDVLTAIRVGTPVDKLGTQLDQNRERHLRSLDGLRAIYPPEMLEETVALADRCTFSLDELRYEYPRELVPDGITPAQHLRALTETGAGSRWPEGVPANVISLIEKELELIGELRYEFFFLTVHDIVRFARERGILCQGRGSAANSAVCYCLGITEVDPARMHLLFERFVSKERNEPPDIDVDFEHERREEVIQYIYEHYGRHRAALAATLITYRPRSAIRDVGKALGLDLDLVDLLAKSMAWWDNRSELDRRLKAAGVDPQSRVARQFLFLVNEILGFPRHLSQHVGGFVISAGPLAELVPIENAAMADRTVIQWDKDDLEALNLLKVDVLGLGMLTAIRKTLALLGELHRPEVDFAPTSIDEIPPEDPETYAMLQRADSLGVFQVESRAQMSMLPRLKPASFYDLVIEVAIVRPGPIQGNMVHPYLRRRQGLEPVDYANDAVRRVLERTLGIPIFQEQVIELAMVAAGFTAGEADQLRRAMAAWRRRGGLEQFEEKLVTGMLERGLDRGFAERVFEQIKGFGEYGFPESHAASFALLVYVSAWLKRHEPTAFYCGLLNSLPMGFYSPSQIIHDATAHGIEVLPADVQKSGWDYRLEPPMKAIPNHRNAQPALRLGLRQVKGMGEEAARRIEAAQPFRDIDDLTRQSSLDDGTLTILARAGALKNLSGHRYQAHWDAAGVDHPTALWQEAPTAYSTSVALAEPSEGDDMLADYRYLGLTLGRHPMALLRDETEFDGCRPASELAACRHEQFVHVAGLVTCRQRPGSASGVVFMTLEDETGVSNIVVWNSVLERFRAPLLQGRLIAVKGVVEREGIVIHVVAGHVRDLTHKLAELTSEDGSTAGFKSRNFH